MIRTQRYISSLFSFFLVTTVLLLAPGQGFATLAIPDNEQDTAITIPDTTHASKRVADDATHLVPDMAGVEYFTQGTQTEFAVISEESHTLSEYKASQLNYIRGPPVEHTRT